MRALMNQRFATLAVLAVVIALLPLVFPSSYYFRVGRSRSLPRELAMKADSPLKWLLYTPTWSM